MALPRALAPGLPELLRSRCRSTAPVLWVAVVFGVLQPAVVPLWLPLGWDEAVYASQVSPRVPAAYFSAPRARGISWLAAPAVLLSGSTVVLRAWMLLAATAGLAAAYWPWRRLLGEARAALAAGLFAGLWIVGFYANEVMPNLYVAYGTTAAVGWFLVAAEGGGRGRALPALAVSVACTALFRPPDAVLLAGVLLVAAVLPALRRGVRPAAAVAAGLAVGLLPWLVEAYTEFGGPWARLRQGSAVQGGMVWTNAVGMHLKALNGPLLCRPCDIEWTHGPLALWWLATPVVTVAALVMARRGGVRTARTGRLGRPPSPSSPLSPRTVPMTAVALPAACAAVVAAQYLFLVGYAAPRFLLPAYALLALPAACFLAGLCTAASGRRRPVLAVLLAAGIAAHLLSQYLVLQRRTADQRELRAATGQAARWLHGVGLRPPCTLVGPEVVPLAFHAGCASEALSGNNASITEEALHRATRTRHVAAAGHSPHPPPYARSWAPRTVRTPDGTVWYVFVAPAPR
ncbi:hypothetical protein [Streptomyces sp. I05A-00742]|uniref:hypothetical protein n=1 Tax=Streptomyces sp. I05A-00742 TaxID=2732853 RepID=UPI001487AE95|nr:hypothetical protein [Streptomyces sp. I05A-00742]